MSLVWIVLGLVLLVVGGEFLVRSSVSLSFKFNISKLVIGMTVVSFATSAPELLVSLQAALDGSPDIALGNVIGAQHCQHWSGFGDYGYYFSFVHKRGFL